MAKRRTTTKKRPQRKTPPDQVYRRDVAIRAEDVDEESRSVDVSFSSETDTVRFWGVPQILLHEKGAADLKSLRSVLFNHNPDNVVGRADNAWVDEKERKGRATIVFDDDPDSDRVFRKISGGSIDGMSVGFRATKWQVLNDGEEWKSPAGRTFKGPADIATAWRAIEFSVTPIPADATVGAGRSNGGSEPQEFSMNSELKKRLIARGLAEDATDEEAQEFLARVLDEPEPKDDGGDTPPPAHPPPEGGKGRTAADPEAEERGARKERERVRAIRGVCETSPQTRELADDLIDSGATIEQARAACLKRLQETQPPIGNQRRVEFGEEERTKFRATAEDWLMSRTYYRDMVPENRRQAARDFPCLSLMDLARECVRRANIRPVNAGVDGILEAALGKRAMSHSISDFPNILSSNMNKVLLKAYFEAPATWRPLVRIGSVSDFKNVYRIRLGDAGNLLLTKDGVPMPEMSFAETQEYFAIDTYARRFGIGRQALINDDLDAFDRIPRQMGQAARRVPGTLFWALLTSASGVGPTMAEDAKALFATDHTSGANYKTGAFAIDVANLGTARSYMRKQKGLVPAGETAPVLNITPRYLVVPAVLETTAAQLIASTVDPSKYNMTPNPFSQQLTVIAEPALDAATDGTTAWYLAADPGLVDGAEVAFLNGREEPSTVREDGTNVLGVEWGVYLDCGVKFIDHRGWFRAKGA